MTDPRVSELQRLLPQCLLPDWVRLGARAVRLFRDQHHPDAHEAILQRLLASARESVALRQRRAEFVPRTTYPENLPITAWKAYCHAGGPGWFLDDHDPDAPQCGEAFLAQAEALGITRVAIHKGFTMIGGTAADAATYSDPVDIGPAAAAHPDLDIIVYHSGYDVGPAEGAYNEANTFGVDRLITSVRKAGIEAGGNVYAELGSTWRFVMSKPTEAAHVLGKLLLHIGEDNVVWGTDSIWYGSPQDQIESLRAFQISEEFQERYGYPALTDAVKRKIFGLNAARLHGLDPAAGACRFDRG